MAITTRNSVFINRGKGLGYTFPCSTIDPGVTTGATAASGFHTVQIVMSDLGTTYPGTLIGLQLPASPPQSLFANLALGVGPDTARGAFLARIYQIGTVNLAATGNQFTHDSATFPVLRTQFGVASQAITLIPILYITTATATTAPIFLVRNATGPAAGYTNQGGSTITGTKTMTMPSTATAAQSGFVIRLENGDTGMRDISNIDVTTAGSAGAGTIFGAELLLPLGQPSSINAVIADALFGGLRPLDLVPAVPTAGTLTSYLCFLTVGQTTGRPVQGFFSSVLNS